MEEKKQLRSFDVYTTYVHNIQNKIMYIKSYNADRFTNVLTVRFKNGSVNQFDISTVESLKEAIRMVNCKIKGWRKKNGRV